MEEKHDILRFNFSEDIMDMINEFAKLHQFDDRHTYKEQWNTWFEEHQVELLAEIKQLEEHGYKGNAKDKMYKAGRYYFRKKIKNTNTDTDTNTNTVTDTNKNKTKRTYIAMDKAFIDEIDKHILVYMRAHRVHGTKYTPANGYADFCKEAKDVLEREQRRLMTDTAISGDRAEMKIKKTYKNRCFLHPTF
jgi:hypothetical protein